MTDVLPFVIQPQPDDTSCGPTCLHAVYAFSGDTIGLAEVIEGTRRLDNGGTLAVFLGCHALARGYAVTLHTFNLQVFDPTWFGPPPADLATKLRDQMAVKTDPKLHEATSGYLEFLRLGGEIRFTEMNRDLLRSHLRRSLPILTGLSATYLYRCAREISAQNEYDDLRGEPVGHFVVLYGYEPQDRLVLVADPYVPNPLAGTFYYRVPIDRVISAILLGTVTYDANMLVLGPRRPRKD
ncbi:MAG: hypothetical protein JXQ29_03460 [Planctomycetes bacterium]|nr:hypothetical protein [Planctomycetota bacterium]